MLFVVTGSAGEPAVTATGRVHPPVSLLRKGVSTNWAGYAAETSLASPVPNGVTKASGNWVVPTVSCSAGETSYSSTWAGIDGYSTNTVEQTGIDANCSSGSATYDAWYEMYPKPAWVLNPSLFPVAPGDHMSASVEYQGSGDFQLTIANYGSTAWVTQTWQFTTTQKSNKAQRESAEWIVEAPGRSTLPLANFGTVEFSSAGATINGHTGTINDSNWQNDAITKVGTETATPSSLSNGGSSFDVTFAKPAVASKVYVSGVTYALTRKGGPKLSVTVHVINDLAQPVSGASVSIDLLRDGSTVLGSSGTTASDGTVTFVYDSPSSGTYTADITSLSASGLAWDGTTPPNSYTK
jgi:peptidase A4-like protein